MVICLCTPGLLWGVSVHSTLKIKKTKNNKKKSTFPELKYIIWEKAYASPGPDDLFLLAALKENRDV